MFLFHHGIGWFPYLPFAIYFYYSYYFLKSIRSPPPRQQLLLPTLFPLLKSQSALSFALVSATPWWITLLPSARHRNMASRAFWNDVDLMYILFLCNDTIGFGWHWDCSISNSGNPINYPLDGPMDGTCSGRLPPLKQQQQQQPRITQMRMIHHHHPHHKKLHPSWWWPILQVDGWQGLPWGNNTVAAATATTIAATHECADS